MLFDATPDYVRFLDGELSTEYRYLRRRDLATSIRLASGPTWQASFTGSGTGVFYAWYHDAIPGPGTVSFTTGVPIGNRINVTITGSGTEFTSGMVGQYMACEGNDTAFKIVSYTSPTHVNGDVAAIVGTGTSTSSEYRIGPGFGLDAQGPFATAHGPFEFVEK